MKISVDFNELSKVLGYVNTVLADKSVDDKVKNVIFLVNDSSVTVVGYNQITFSRTVLENATLEDIQDSWEFQIKASELNKIMSAYSNLSKTSVSSLDIETSGVRIRITIHETPNKEEDAKLAKDSVFEVENAPIIAKVLTDVKTEYPEESEEMVSTDLLVYISSLMPLMSNDSANSNASKLNFAEDYVFTMSSSSSAFLQNKLPDNFKNITLGYSSVSFIKKICENVESVSVAKTDMYLCISAGNTQAFMRYKPIKINYKVYVEKKSKERGIVVDRLYLKDVLRRLLSTSIDGKILISSNENMTVANEVFQQEVPLNGCKENTEGIGFKISIPILSSLILGSDDLFSGDLFIYFVETVRGYIIYIQDKTGHWFSSTQVVKA